MTHTAKATSTASAITALADAGITRTTIAAELGVHRTTTARWAKGTNGPSARNRAALRALVDGLLRQALAGQCLTSRRQSDALQAAHAALLSDTERAEMDDLAARIAASMAAAQRVSVTATVDPFALVRDRKMCAADAIDHAFAA